MRHVERSDNWWNKSAESAGIPAHGWYRVQGQPRGCCFWLRGKFDKRSVRFDGSALRVAKVSYFSFYLLITKIFTVISIQLPLFDWIP